MKFLKWTPFLLVLLLLAAIPAVTAQESSAQVYVEASVVPDALYVRSGPGTSYAILGQLRHGDIVGILARSPYNPAVQTWVYVQGSGLEGWVNAAFLQFPENYVLVGVPERGASGATASTVTNTSTTTTVSAPEGGVSGISNDFVNLREGPGLEFNVIRQYPPDTRFTAIGRNGNAVWIQVVINGQQGWVFYQLVDVDGNRNNLPVTYGAAPAPQPPANTTTTTTTTTTTNTNTTTAPAAGRNPNGTYAISFGPAPGFVQTFKYGDGRISKNRNFGAAIIYCIDSNHYVTTGTWQGGGIIVYHYIDPSQGVVFFATDAQINAAGIPSGGPKLIKSEAGYSLYRLNDGQFQMVGEAGVPFVITWSNCTPPY